jgi:hypothetical protein
MINLNNLQWFLRLLLDQLQSRILRISLVFTYWLCACSGANVVLTPEEIKHLEEPYEAQDVLGHL